MGSDRHLRFNDDLMAPTQINSTIYEYGRITKIGKAVERPTPVGFWGRLVLLF